MMTPFPMEIGRIVYSRAGRDAGSHYIIVAQLDDTYVAIANGCLRKADNPKKKKIKHLTARPKEALAIKEALLAGRKILDSDIRKALEAAGYTDSLPTV